jgi:hypothetical protein
LKIVQWGLLCWSYLLTLCTVLFLGLRCRGWVNCNPCFMILSYYLSLLFPLSAYFSLPLPTPNSLPAKVSYCLFVFDVYSFICICSYKMCIVLCANIWIYLTGIGSASHSILLSYSTLQDSSMLMLLAAACHEATVCLAPNFPNHSASDGWLDWHPHPWPLPSCCYLYIGNLILYPISLPNPLISFNCLLILLAYLGKWS